MPANVSIVITAKDQASGVLKGVGSTLGSIAKIAAGIGAAAVAGFGIMAKSALDATADYEKLTMQLTSLSARELINADSTLTMTEAYKLAGGATQELLKWSQELGIHSPFDQQTIANSLQQAMNYGFTADEAKRVTQNLVDMGSAMGFTSDKMGLVSYALGQIHSSDKLLTQDLRQLISAGVPVNDILAKMGYTLADVGKEAISSADFLEEFNKMVETDFAGSGDRMTKTWSGMLSTFQDIKSIGLRTLFADSFAVLQPLVGKLQDWLLGPGLVKLEEWGKALGNLTQNLVDLFTGAKKLDLSDMTAGFADWADSINWATLSQSLADGMNSVDWVAIGAEVRTAAINIFNGLESIVSEVDWGALTAALGNALGGVIAGLAGFVSWDAFALALSNSLANTFGYVGEDAIYQLAADFQAGLTAIQENFRMAFAGIGSLVLMSIVSTGGSVVAWLLTALRNGIQGALNAITSIFGTAAGNWMKGLAQGILNGISTVISAIRKLVNQINNVLSSIITPNILGGNKPASASGLGGASAGTSGGVAPSGGNGGVPQFAGGGIARGSTSGHLAMLHGTEGVFTREQMAMLSPSGGGGVTINLTYAPAFSTASASEVENILMPFIQRGINQSRRGR